MLRLIFRDPLMQLLVIGAAVYVLYFLITDNQSEESTADLLTLKEVEEYIHNKEEEKISPLTYDQKRQLIETYIDNTLLYTEATRLGLAHDSLIKDRMAKMARFYLEGEYTPPDISDSKLKGHYEQHQSLYKRPPTISFEQRLIFSRDIGKVEQWINSNLDESELIENLTRASKESPLSSQFTNANYEGIEQIFGAGFLAYLQKQSINRWSGMISSPFGTHIVKVIQRQSPSILSFDNAKEQVLYDLHEDLKNQWMQSRMEQLRQSYNINIEDYLIDEEDH